MRDEVLCSLISDLARTIGGEDAELEAALLMSCVAGMSLARYVLELRGLAGVSRTDVEGLLLPALQALIGEPD